MKKLATALCTVALAFGTLGVLAPAAQAGTPGCVTFKEYHRIGGRAMGLAPWQVRQVFGTAGQVWYDDGADLVRTYRKCRSFDGGRGRVGINFDNYSRSGGMRLYQKVRHNPFNLDFYLY